MQVVIRTDSSTILGAGHLMRCLTLAEMLAETGADVCFVSADLPGNCYNIIDDVKYDIRTFQPAPNQLEDAERTIHAFNGLPEPSLLVVDHYSLDAVWERRVRPYVKKIMVIDDLANRYHDCDYLLDQNYFSDYLSRYNALVPANCRVFLGPQNVLLRKEFIEARKTLRRRDGSVRAILISFGGSDPTNETLKALKALELINRPDLMVDVVIGMANPHKTDIEAFASGCPNYRLHYSPSAMAPLIAATDLAIGAAGTSTWERCYLGLPTVVIAVAPNQVPIAEHCAKAGFMWYAGKSDCVSPSSLSVLLKNHLSSSQALKHMSGAITDLVDCFKISDLIDGTTE